MEFLKKLDLTGMQFMKLIGLLIIGFVALFILVNIFSSSFGLSSRGMSTQSMQNPLSVSNGIGGSKYGETASLSARNAELYNPSIDGGYTTGSDSEAFEVKEYSARIETRDREKDCNLLRGLRARTDVVFENMSEQDRGCSFTFKVKKESVEEVLGVIKGLDPEELIENSYTIKREVDDYTSEIQILQNKLTSLDATLTDAIASYGNITALASHSGNVDSLAKIIESKITIIDRLTSARIETSNQLERMNRAKSESLDRLLYTYFTVSVSENLYIDGASIKSSWKFAVQQFIRETNVLLQDLSLGLVGFLLMVMKLTIYFVIVVFVTRFGWSFAKKVWGRGVPQGQ
jgi:hypothetical protein